MDLEEQEIMEKTLEQLYECLDLLERKQKIDVMSALAANVVEFMNMECNLTASENGITQPMSDREKCDVAEKMVEAAFKTKRYACVVKNNHKRGSMKAMMKETNGPVAKLLYEGAEPPKFFCPQCKGSCEGSVHCFKK